MSPSPRRPTSPTPTARARNPVAPLYRHTQFGTAIAFGTAFGLALATIVVASLSNQTLAAAGWLVVALYAVLGLAFALFFRLTIQVDAVRVRASFGIGIVQKAVDVTDIRRTDIVRTRLWWGYGVHWTASGWLYNVGGRKAVRLELRGERPVIFGTDEPEALKEAIDARVAARGHEG